jgi:hypothetical protein
MFDSVKHGLASLPRFDIFQAVFCGVIAREVAILQYRGPKNAIEKTAAFSGEIHGLVLRRKPLNLHAPLNGAEWRAALVNVDFSQGARSQA